MLALLYLYQMVPRRDLGLWSSSRKSYHLAHYGTCFSFIQRTRAHFVDSSIFVIRNVQPNTSLSTSPFAGAMGTADIVNDVLSLNNQMISRACRPICMKSRMQCSNIQQACTIQGMPSPSLTSLVYNWLNVAPARFSISLAVRRGGGYWWICLP